MRVAVSFPDVEHLLVDHLTTVLPSVLDPVPTVSVGVPVTWKPSSVPHVEVAWDGTPIQIYPLIARPTIRVVVRAGSPTEAKRIASIVHGVLLGPVIPPGVSNVLPLTGVLPARDVETRAELASFTVQVTVRSQPIEP
jgi:hypothetical protein